jgi:hypothetical protein
MKFLTLLFLGIFFTMMSYGQNSFLIYTVKGNVSGCRRQCNIQSQNWTAIA